MKNFIKNVIENISYILMLQEILITSILVILYAFALFIIRLLLIPCTYFVKALVGIAHFADERGEYHTNILKNMYNKILEDDIKC